MAYECHVRLFKRILDRQRKREDGEKREIVGGTRVMSVGHLYAKFMTDSSQISLDMPVTLGYYR